MSRFSRTPDGKVFPSLHLRTDAYTDSCGHHIWAVVLFILPTYWHSWWRYWRRAASHVRAYPKISRRWKEITEAVTEIKYICICVRQLSNKLQHVNTKKLRTLSIPVLLSVGISLYPFCSSSHAQVVLNSWHTCEERNRTFNQHQINLFLVSKVWSNT